MQVIVKGLSHMINNASRAPTNNEILPQAIYTTRSKFSWIFTISSSSDATMDQFPAMDGSQLYTLQIIQEILISKYTSLISFLGVHSSLA